MTSLKFFIFFFSALTSIRRREASNCTEEPQKLQENSSNFRRKTKVQKETICIHQRTTLDRKKGCGGVLIYQMFQISTSLTMPW